MKEPKNTTQLPYVVERWSQYKLGESVFTHDKDRDKGFATVEEAEQYAVTSDGGFGGDMRYRYMVKPVAGVITGTAPAHTIVQRALTLHGEQASRNRLGAARAGSASDGGAGHMEDLALAFQTGWRHGIPSWLESYVQQAQNEADPEWAEFQRLQAKFKKVP